MTSSRPYLLRALYDWIVDNGLTPHLLVNTTAPGIQVPEQHAKEGRIVLNIAPRAAQDLQLGSEFITFSARFGGVARGVNVPVSAVLGIYAAENGQGMAFNNEGGNSPPPAPEGTATSAPTASKPKLKLVT